MKEKTWKITVECKPRVNLYKSIDTPTKTRVFVDPAGCVIKVDQYEDADNTIYLDRYHDLIKMEVLGYFYPDHTEVAEYLHSEDTQKKLKVISDEFDIFYDSDLNQIGVWGKGEKLAEEIINDISYMTPFWSAISAHDWIADIKDSLPTGCKNLSDMARLIKDEARYERTIIIGNIVKELQGLKEQDKKYISLIE